MRLDKFVSQSSGLSRKETKIALKQGRITVDGYVIVSADYVVDENSLVELDGEDITPPGKRYYMLNKPEGVVCSTSDPRHPTVISLIDEPRAENLHPVGRLDIDTTGLVLLTDDGQWSHGITSPKKQKNKVYLATLAEPLVENAEKKFEKGMMLDGETKRTLPASLERLSPTEIKVTLQEGRYHQVKRMFAALGNCVIALHRESIGTLQLDPQLQPGQYRPLTNEEIEALK
jgi:16S rRNA pseudouridine516 synthase